MVLQWVSIVNLIEPTIKLPLNPALTEDHVLGVLTQPYMGVLSS